MDSGDCEVVVITFLILSVVIGYVWMHMVAYDAPIVTVCPSRIDCARRSRIVRLAVVPMGWS
jgi:hypothetical protein